MKIGTLVIVASCILVPANSVQLSDVAQTLAPIVIPPEFEGGNSCPADAVEEEAEQNITGSVRMLLKSILGFRPVAECGEGVWKRVAFLNMSDPNMVCPANWRLYSQDNVRACGRQESGDASCSQELFAVTSASNVPLEYSKVCGRIIGYQFASTTPFETYTLIDEPYVNGISLTYGSPRTHIWTFATGLNDNPHNSHACPCASDANFQIPSFVQNHYFCETGYNNADDYQFILFPDDPLWDGQNCPRGDCCSFNNPPWFSVDLDAPTTDSIEVRICADQGTADEDSPIGLLELYVQ